MVQTTKNEENDEIPDDDEREELIANYFSANTVCAFAADINSIKNYFIFIEDSCEA